MTGGSTPFRQSTLVNSDAGVPVADAAYIVPRASRGTEPLPSSPEPHSPLADGGKLARRPAATARGLPECFPKSMPHTNWDNHVRIDRSRNISAGGVWVPKRKDGLARGLPQATGSLKPFAGERSTRNTPSIPLRRGFQMATMSRSDKTLRPGSELGYDIYIRDLADSAPARRSRVGTECSEIAPPQPRGLQLVSVFPHLVLAMNCWTCPCRVPYVYILPASQSAPGIDLVRTADIEARRDRRLPRRSDPAPACGPRSGR